MAVWERGAGFLCAAAVISFTGVCWGQAGGRLAGHVATASGVAVAGANVRVEHQETGASHATRTSAVGFFAFPTLPAGDYSISVLYPGFARTIRSGIRIGVASESLVDIVLSPGMETQVIYVEDRSPDSGGTTGSHGFFDRRAISNLPINGRDFGRFAMLSPGAVLRSGAIADITFFGLHSTMNTFTLDGVDATRVDLPYLANGNERGARLLTGSLDSIAEFRAQISNYRAEFGRSASASVAILSRSGGAEWHGNVLHYFRNDLLDARNYFNAAPARQSPFRYNNFGGNLGGPLARNTFLFANYEGSRQRVGIVGTGTVPSQTFRETVRATSPVLEPLLLQYPLGSAPTADPRVDLHTANGILAIREDSGSFRLDRYWNSLHRSYARLNVNDTESSGPMFSVNAMAIGTMDRQFVPVRTINGVLNHTSVLSPRIVVEWIAGIQRWESLLNQQALLPLTTVVGLTAAPGSRGAARQNSTVLQGGSQLSWTRGRHTWKSGASVWKSAVNTSTESQISLVYGSLEDFSANRLTQVQISPRDPGSGRRQLHLGLFVQDTWQPARALTIDYGFRWDFAPPNHGDAPRYRSFDTRINDLGSVGAPWYAAQRKDLAPRLGFAWQPLRALQVRGGYGLFRQITPVGLGNAISLNTIPGASTFLRADNPGIRWPIEPYLNQSIQPAPSVAGFHWDRPNLYTQQWNLTMEISLSRTLAAETGYIGNRGINLRRIRNLNLIDRATGRRPLPRFSTVNVDYADGQSVYHALQLGLLQRYGKRFQGSLRYTFAKAIDDVQDYAVGSTAPQNLLCGGRCERGPGSTDVRHSVTVQGVYDWRGVRRAPRFIVRLASGWQISGLGLFRSGLAAPVTQGSNTFGDGNLVNQRPNAVPGVALLLSNPTPERWYDAQALTVPPAGTYGNLGRNMGRGPSFLQADGSASKTISLTEVQSLQFRAEVFNAFNHPNFDLPSGVFGTAGFGRVLNTVGRTMGFGTARQIQLSIRWRF